MHSYRVQELLIEKPLVAVTLMILYTTAITSVDIPSIAWLNMSRNDKNLIGSVAIQAVKPFVIIFIMAEFATGFFLNLWLTRWSSTDL